jgi:hypothetical protein
MTLRSLLLPGSALFISAAIALTSGTKPSPTFAKDVAPILYKNCVGCHRPGEIGPFSLMGYGNAKKWSKMIATVTKDGQMPPWKAASHGEFLDENRLTEEEIQTIADWSSAGAPRGNAKEEPKPPVFTSGWTLGDPDAILQPEKPVVIAAEGKDEYRNYVIKTNYPETRYLSAIDCKPGNKAVVHHMVVYLDEKGVSQKLVEKRGDGKGGYVTDGGISPGFIPDSVPYIWVPGERARHMPTGVGITLKPGATLVMQIHYHRNGKPEKDLTKLGLYFAKEKPAKNAEVDVVADFGLKVPAGKVTNWESSMTLRRDTTMYSIMPHMHLLGQSMKAEATLPDGTTKQLVDVQKWDYNWQFNYAFKEPVKLPKGSKIHVTASYDNTAANPRNPANPPKDVAWGEQTNDEMFVLLFTVTYGF